MLRRRGVGGGWRGREAVQGESGVGNKFAGSQKAAAPDIKSYNIDARTPAGAMSVYEPHEFSLSLSLSLSLLHDDLDLARCLPSRADRRTEGPSFSRDDIALKPIIGGGRGPRRAFGECD
jgi:hypothetical protein